jgi:hypothetical protein
MFRLLKLKLGEPTVEQRGMGQQATTDAEDHWDGPTAGVEPPHRFLKRRFTGPGEASICLFIPNPGAQVERAIP